MANVLVIDDSPLIVRFVRKALVTDGHTVHGLDSFIRLASRVREDPPDLIILDLNIPVLSGVAMGKLVRSYQSRDIPIVVYSSAPREQLRSAARDVRAHAFVRKSEDAEPLRQAVAQVLLERRAVGE